MIKYTAAFVDKLEDILSESGYTVRYERGNFQSGWCLLDHKRIVVLNKFLNTEGRVNTLVDLIPQLKIDFDKLTLNSQKIYEFLTRNQVPVPEERPEEKEAELSGEATDNAADDAPLNTAEEEAEDKDKDKDKDKEEEDLTTTEGA